MGPDAAAEPLVVVTPVKNEMGTIERMAASVLHQTEPCREWVIIDDGSTDGTEGYLQSLAESTPSVNLLRLPPDHGRDLGARQVYLIERGLGCLNSSDWSYWAKVDADLILAPHYFERILARFEEDADLGIVSGKPLLPARAGSWRSYWTPDYYPLGMARIYRRACWQDLGGLMAGRQYDVLDIYTARFKGWRTASIQETTVKLLRQVEARMPRQLERRAATGSDLYSIGYHPLYLFMRALRSGWDERPPLLAGLAMMWGYLRAAIRGQKRVGPDLFKFVRREQWKMIRSRQPFQYVRERFGGGELDAGT